MFPCWGGDEQALLKEELVSVWASGELSKIAVKRRRRTTLVDSRVWHLVSRLLGIETFLNFLRVSVSVSKILVSKKSLGIGLDEIFWSRHSVSFRRGRQGRHTLNLACSWLWCWRHPFLCSRSASKKADGWTDIWKLQERRRQPLLHWVLFRQLFFLNNFRHLDIFHPALPSSFNSALRDLGLCFSPLTFVFISSR